MRDRTCWILFGNKPPQRTPRSASVGASVSTGMSLPQRERWLSALKNFVINHGQRIKNKSCRSLVLQRIVILAKAKTCKWVLYFIAIIHSLRLGQHKKMANRFPCIRPTSVPGFLFKATDRRILHIFLNRYFKSNSLIILRKHDSAQSFTMVSVVVTYTTSHR